MLLFQFHFCSNYISVLVIFLFHFCYCSLTFLFIYISISILFLFAYISFQFCFCFNFVSIHFHFYSNYISVPITSYYNYFFVSIILCSKYISNLSTASQMGYPPAPFLPHQPPHKSHQAHIRLPNHRYSGLCPLYLH